MWKQILNSLTIMAKIYRQLRCALWNKLQHDRYNEFLKYLDTPIVVEEMEIHLLQYTEIVIWDFRI